MFVAVPHGRAVETPEVPRVDQGVVGHNHVAGEEGKKKDKHSAQIENINLGSGVVVVVVNPKYL